MCKIQCFRYTCRHRLTYIVSACSTEITKAHPRIEGAVVAACSSTAYITIHLPTACGDCLQTAWEAGKRREIEEVKVELDGRVLRGEIGENVPERVLAGLEEWIGEHIWGLKSVWPGVERADQVSRRTLGDKERKPSPLRRQLRVEDLQDTGEENEDADCKEIKTNAGDEEEAQGLGEQESLLEPVIDIYAAEVADSSWLDEYLAEGSNTMDQLEETSTTLFSPLPFFPDSPSTSPDLESAQNWPAWGASSSTSTPQSTVLTAAGPDATPTHTSTGYISLASLDLSPTPITQETEDEQVENLVSHYTHTLTSTSPHLSPSPPDPQHPTTPASAHQTQLDGTRSRSPNFTNHAMSILHWRTASPARYFSTYLHISRLELMTGNGVSGVLIPATLAPRPASRPSQDQDQNSAD